MQRRKELGMTQEKLAEQIGISKNHLSNIERGKNLPTVPLLFKLCDAMGETPDYYLIGKLSAGGEDLVKLIGRMPGPQQEQARKLVKAYFEL
ncbi:MAG: helix-turn-helix transcriptional regulator [Paludibacteraceae bacterium]|nr:helix-turn-helix transcriptional regulator [Paludibacteraceae bacterium]